MQNKHPHETSEATMNAYRLILLLLLWAVILLWISPLATFAQSPEAAQLSGKIAGVQSGPRPI